MPIQLTVMVPALNEALCIERTIVEVEQALDKVGITGEILAFNDGSSDATGSIMEVCAARDSRVRVIHHERPMGLGYDYWEASKEAKGEFLVLIPGDAEITGASIEYLFSKTGVADIVSCYAINPVIRGWKRRMISRAYVALVNLFFGYGLRYYNGPCIVRVSLLHTLSQPTTSFAYMTEIIVQLLDRGAQVCEVEMTLRRRPSGKTKAFAWKNIVGVIQTLVSLYHRLRSTR